MVEDSKTAVVLSFLAVFSLTILILFTLCGICRSTDRCFTESRRKEPEQAGFSQFSDIKNQNGNASASQNIKISIEMPDRSQNYQVRQRNYDID
mmetsp:Transcript_17998/g.30645  ORF Transcript_17998/g.30645 Transcript_17998/m.30645 type:complete len:94 (-) Transcript_17998:32-313(-)